MAYKYYKVRKYSSDCHVFEFDPNEIRFDATIGIAKRLERLSKINGEPKADEYTVAKLNGGFFAMNGATEYIGSFVDEGKYYNGASQYYPTLVFWKENNRLTVENNPNQERHAYYQSHAWWAIGVPWTLVIDGKINYTYDRNLLQKMFGHPNYRAPRTLVGQKADGTIVWVVVDGRRTTTLGANIEHSAKIMIELGCQIAVNLDGGGSSEMIVNDKIVNRPSDNCERAIGTAFCAYAKRPSTTELDYGSLGTVTATTLNVRSGPGTKYGKIGTVSKNSSVKIVAKANGNWYKIIYGNGYGYVSASYIKEVNVPADAPTPKNIGVVTTSLRLRSGPSTNYKQVGLLPAGTQLSLLEEVNGWYKVTYKGVTGYCSGAYIKV